MLRYLTGLNDQDLETEIIRLRSDDLPAPTPHELKSGILMKVTNENADVFGAFCSDLQRLCPLNRYQYSDQSTNWLLHLPQLSVLQLAKFTLYDSPDQIQQPLHKAFCQLIENLQVRNWQYQFGNRTFSLDHPMIMGILNVTPDSFSDGGQYFDPDKAVDHAIQLAEEGADIIDIGGESSRPGAEPVSEKEEWQRIKPVLEKLASRGDLLLSVDTYKATIARRALESGAHIINDISGMTLDDDMAGVIAGLDAPVVLMHMPDRPKTMQNSPFYQNLMDEVWQAMAERVSVAQEKGIRQIIIDPGIGFGKRLADNYELIRRLGEFRALGLPLLIGTSRKAFIRDSLGSDAENSLLGSVTTSLISVINGAQIVRVHDVTEMRQAFANFVRN